jgi:hypothetical protein
VDLGSIPFDEDKIYLNVTTKDISKGDVYSLDKNNKDIKDLIGNHKRCQNISQSIECSRLSTEFLCSKRMDCTWDSDNKLCYKDGDADCSLFKLKNNKTGLCPPSNCYKSSR